MGYICKAGKGSWVWDDESFDTKGTLYIISNVLKASWKPNTTPTVNNIFIHWCDTRPIYLRLNPSITDFDMVHWRQKSSHAFYLSVGEVWDPPSSDVGVWAVDPGIWPHHSIVQDEAESHSEMLPEKNRRNVSKSSIWCTQPSQPSPWESTPAKSV